MDKVKKSRLICKKSNLVENVGQKRIVPKPPSKRVFFSRKGARHELLLKALAEKMMGFKELVALYKKIKINSKPIGSRQTLSEDLKDLKKLIYVKIETDFNDPKLREKYTLTPEGLEARSRLKVAIDVLSLKEKQYDQGRVTCGRNQYGEPHLLSLILVYGLESRAKFGKLLAEDLSIEEDLLHLCSWLIYHVLERALENKPTPKREDWNGIILVLKDIEYKLKAKLQDSQVKKRK